MVQYVYHKKTKLLTALLHLLLQTLNKIYSYAWTKQIENKAEQRS